MKKTIILNLFAGPGAGKSTGATYIFSRLKMKGVDCEYVSEFAKDKVWEENKEVFKCQEYITVKQLKKLKMCYGKVDVIITDSPILLGCIYDNTDNPFFGDFVLTEFNKFNNRNYFLERTKKYNPNGRNQTELEARNLDSCIKEYLDGNNIEYGKVKGNIEGYDTIVNDILYNCLDWSNKGENGKVKKEEITEIMNIHITPSNYNDNTFNTLKSLMETTKKALVISWLNNKLERKDKVIWYSCDLNAFWYTTLLRDMID